MTAMATILTTVVSIAALTALAWAARKLLRAPLCPICTGVAGTWLWMVVARQIGVELDGTMLSVLLGGSAVGLSYQLETHLPPGRSVLLWKSLFFPAALVTAYGIASPDWLVLAGAAGPDVRISRAAARTDDRWCGRLEARRPDEKLLLSTGIAHIRYGSLRHDR